MLFDRVQETTATTGTGAITPAGAVAGYRSFASVYSAGNTVDYVVVSGSAWQTATGTWNGTTLSVDTVLDSSAAGAQISLSGTSTIFVDLVAARTVERGLAAALAQGLGTY